MGSCQNQFFVQKPQKPHIWEAHSWTKCPNQVFLFKPWEKSTLSGQMINCPDHDTNQTDQNPRANSNLGFCSSILDVWAKNQIPAGTQLDWNFPKGNGWCSMLNLRVPYIAQTIMYYLKHITEITYHITIIWQTIWHASGFGWKLHPYKEAHNCAKLGGCNYTEGGFLLVHSCQTSSI